MCRACFFSSSCLGQLVCVLWDAVDSTHRKDTNNENAFNSKKRLKKPVRILASASSYQYNWVSQCWLSVSGCCFRGVPLHKSIRCVWHGGAFYGNTMEWLVFSRSRKHSSRTHQRIVWQLAQHHILFDLLRWSRMKWTVRWRFGCFLFHSKVVNEGCV